MTNSHVEPLPRRKEWITLKPRFIYILTKILFSFRSFVLSPEVTKNIHLPRNTLKRPKFLKEVGVILMASFNRWRILTFDKCKNNKMTKRQSIKKLFKKIGRGNLLLARCIIKMSNVKMHPLLVFLTPFSYLDSYILVDTVNSISSSFISNSTFQSFRIRLTAADRSLQSSYS